ncbi:hypothetical protein BB560_006447 [Smittium megazygosporum]|uniref:Pyridine nucleotide-disulphide oxidoreductase dimerisation domain-containing protein n=1 Tax=Smittium megazygosporum TaxID=133381 RepID=A0A2T9Y5U1_9FUNG|nr:hypothetical protein BB560_006447 [Smittium megazygosporum]
MSTKVVSCTKTADGVSVELESVDTGKRETITADVVLVSVGRRPYTEGLGLENTGIQLDGRGFIPNDHKLKTNVPHIRAIGDVTTGPMLAHKAEEEGVAAVEDINTSYCEIDHEIIPSVIYTHPEVAFVGKNEQTLKKENVKYKVGTFSFAANSRAKAVDDSDGLVKVIIDANTEKLLGVHIICSCAGELIAEATLAMTYSGSAEDIARSCHAHPTFSEALKEACLAAYSLPINS